MEPLVVYFTATSPPPFEPFIDPYNYFFKGEELLVPPCSLVICVPCQNMDPNHFHNLYDCRLLTYARGWDVVQYDDYVTVYVLDNESTRTTIYLETGELLSTFLVYNEVCYGVNINKCVMAIGPYWPQLAPEIEANEWVEDYAPDAGYESSNMSE
jgi:hypothetical protein